MKTYTLNFEQKVPISLQEAWDFFSSPLNLAKITPKSMSFVITSDYTKDTKMYEGMLISYEVSPLLGIKMDWVTEITYVKDGEYFIDDQRFGPFALWHHEHHFKSIEGGVLMTDKLTYAVPFGFLGRIANSLVVAKQTQDIFNYREKAVEEMFGVYK
jgi:ligand-binding SRPBCC domain-containing protein